LKKVLQSVGLLQYFFHQVLLIAIALAVLCASIANNPELE